MPYDGNWLPGRRENQLSMAKNWLTVLAAQAPAWNVPSPEVTELQTLTGTADAALTAAQSSERTPVVTANCKAAFDALIAKMRFIKSRYFLSPQLTDAGIISLELKPRDATHTPVPPPTAEADISRPGVHLLELHLRSVAGSPPDPHRSDYGYRIYHGVLPPGGASVELATGAKRELLKVPVSGDDLPHSRFTRRKKELVDFPAKDSGKTVYFCVRYENAKGEPRSWGPMFSSIIP
jgi:hypothetical protein